MRVGAADLQCGVAVETVDSQNPSSYVDYTRFLRVYVRATACGCLYVCTCARAVKKEGDGRGRTVRARRMRLTQVLEPLFIYVYSVLDNKLMIF